MKVRALVTCFIDNGLRKEGEVFEYNGPANGNVEPLDAPREPEQPEVVPVVRPKRGRPAKTTVTAD
jgi:hypothetical protein